MHRTKVPHRRSQSGGPSDVRSGDARGGSSPPVLELVVYFPACVWLYWAYWTGKAYRASLEVFVCAFQLYGTLVYLMQEHYNGYKSFNWLDSKLEFTVNHLFYFWFAVVIGCSLWIVVPTWLTVLALKETVTIPSGKIKVK